MSDSRTVRVQRVMPAVPEDVFDEWLDPESLREWMCPRPTRCVTVTVEARVGGLFRFDVDDEGADVLITGQFVAIERPRLLKFTWVNSYWADPTVSSMVTVTFEPVPGEQTMMSIEHAALPSDEYDNFHHGWVATADQLAALLTNSARN